MDADAAKHKQEPSGKPAPKLPPAATELDGSFMNTRKDRAWDAHCKQQRVLDNKQSQFEQLLGINKPRKPRKPRGPTRDVIPASRKCAMTSSGHAALAEFNANKVNSSLSTRPADSSSSSSSSSILGVSSKMKMKFIRDSTTERALAVEMQRRGKTTVKVVPTFVRDLQMKPGDIDKNTGMPATWPHACWWCTENFDTAPVGCPHEYDNRRGVIKTSGFFCSYNCARAWGIDNLLSHQVAQLGQWMMRMIRAQVAARGEVLDYSKYNISAAASPYALQKFGGVMDIKEFRRIHCSQIRIYCAAQSVKLYPMGFNIFSIPRNSADVYGPPASPRATSWTNSVPPSAKSKKRKSASVNSESNKKRNKRTLREPSKKRRARSYKLGTTQEEEHKGDIRCKPGQEDYVAPLPGSVNDQGVPLPPPRTRTLNQLLRDQRRPENRIRSDSVQFKMQRPEKAKEKNISSIMGIRFN